MLSVKEAADRAGVSVAEVEALAASGVFPGARIKVSPVPHWRIPAQDLDAWVARRSSLPAAPAPADEASATAEPARKKRGGRRVRA